VTSCLPLVLRLIERQRGARDGGFSVAADVDYVPNFDVVSNCAFHVASVLHGGNATSCKLLKYTDIILRNMQHGRGFSAPMIFEQTIAIKGLMAGWGTRIRT
jgi:hypothetical protein